MQGLAPDVQELHLPWCNRHEAYPSNPTRISRLGSIDSDQQTRISRLGSIDSDQPTRISRLGSADSDQSTRISRLASADGVTADKDTEIWSLKSCRRRGAAPPIHSNPYAPKRFGRRHPSVVSATSRGGAGRSNRMRPPHACTQRGANPARGPPILRPPGAPVTIRSPSGSEVRSGPGGADGFGPEA